MKKMHFYKSKSITLKIIYLIFQSFTVVAHGIWTQCLSKDRTLCNLLRKAVAKKDPSDYEIWEKALMEAGDNNCDWTDKKYIEPIMEYIKR